MFRRIVSLLLLPCVLLSQSAAIHAHSSGDLAGQDLRPHLHVTLTPTPHEHGHHHHGSGKHHHHHHGSGSHHHHHHDGEEGRPPRTDVQPNQPAKPFSEDEHHSDTVYLDSVDLILNHRYSPDNGRVASFYWAAAAMLIPGGFWANPLPVAVYWAHGPPDYPCPLYIWQHTFLI